MESLNGHTEIVKILVEKEGIDINAKNNVYFKHLEIQKIIWSFIKLSKTALMNASEIGYREIVKILVEKRGNDINAKDNVYFNNLKF